MMQDFSFVHKYFMAEKQAGLMFLIIGSVALLLSVVFFFFIKSNPSFYKGMAAPLIVIGLLQLIVGITVFSRSDKQRMDVAYNMGIETKAFIKQTEQPRMEKVQQNFTIYKYAELALLIAGIVLIILYRNADKSFWYGLGIALAIQAVVSLGADIMAAKRGETYLNKLTDMGNHK